MGRRTDATGLACHLRERRHASGQSQQELADRVGLTRQSILAIEAGAFVPNTAVALKLADVLGCRVEDLFVFPDGGATRPVDLAEPARAGSERVALARVRGRCVAFPLQSEHGVSEGFPRADGLLAPGAPAAARLLVEPEELERTALMLGCDPAFEIVRDHLERSGGVHLRWISTPSRRALASLARGDAHLAGTHLPGGAGEGANLREARKALAGVGGQVVAFAAWEQGLVVPAGNPRGLHGVEDLARRGLRFVNREPGSGTRTLLDELLVKARVDPAAIPGYDRELGSHLAVSRAVLQGSADAGPGIRAAAELFGLGFVPLAEVRFDLVVPRDQLAHPAVARLLELLAGKALRRELATLPGYDVSRMGSVLAEVPAGRPRRVGA